jgi:SP family general alpha glucoside:H+ symporter-like MFS transporter
MGQYGINMVGTIGAWGLMSIGIGRRKLFLIGLSALTVSLMIMGFLGLAKDKNENASSLATGSMMLVWATCYQLSVGYVIDRIGYYTSLILSTIAFSLVAEMSTRRLQIKTVAMGRAAYNVAAIIVNVLTPYMLNPTAWNWGNYAGFFWAGT